MRGKYEFIERESGRYRIEILCRALKVSRSCYYAYRERLGLPGGFDEEAKRVKECFYKNSRRYGSRRVAAELGMGRFLVRRLMREQNLQAIQPRGFRPRTTDSGHGLLASPNLMLEAKNKPQTWGECVVGDITYIATANGWIYLAMFQDKVTKRLVGWAISDRMTADLVIRALQMALRRGLIKRRCIVHTDRGSQYVSIDFRASLKRCGLRQSMSAKGNCYDNAQAESFFSRFKAELVEGGVFASLAEARTEIFTYIEGFYNPHRLHSSLGYLTPIEFETLSRFDNHNLLTQILNQPVKQRRAMLASILSRNNRPGTHRKMTKSETTNLVSLTHQLPLSIDSLCLKNANLNQNSTKRSERILS